jgi:hypothetical protein
MLSEHIPGSARHFRHYRPFPAKESVEQRRLSGVGPAHQANLHPCREGQAEGRSREKAPDIVPHPVKIQKDLVRLVLNVFREIGGGHESRESRENLLFHLPDAVSQFSFKAAAGSEERRFEGAFTRSRTASAWSSVIRPPR